MPEESAPDGLTDTSILGYDQNYSDEIVSQVSEYSYLIRDSPSFILVGMVVVFVLHRLSSRLLKSYVRNGRMLMVTFGTLYALVLVVTIVLAVRKVGFDVITVGPVAVLIVLFLAVLLYFIISLLPRLPFIPGHAIET